MSFSFSISPAQRTSDGISYTVNFKRKGKKRSTTGTLRISVRAISHAEFKISKESSLDRVAKAIGLSKEVQSGDRNFDEHHYILSDSVAFSTALLKVVEVRQEIASIFMLGFDRVEHDGATISAVMNTANRSDGDASHRTDCVVRALQGISQEISKTCVAAVDNLLAASTKRTISYSICIGAGLTGLIFTIWGSSAYPLINSGELFRDSLEYSVPLYVIVLCLMFFMLRGRSSSHRDFIAFFFIALVGFPLAGYGIGIILNGRNDPGPLIQHSQLITDRYTTTTTKKGRKTTHYHVRYDYWGQPPHQLSHSVSSSEYSAVVPGRSRVEIGVKPGKLGYEWISSWGIQH